MTPFARSIVKQAALPINQRITQYQKLLELVKDVHCFEVSEIHGLAVDLMDHYKDNSFIHMKYVFLPAPRTWLEFESSSSPSSSIDLVTQIKRTGVLLTEDENTIFHTQIHWLKTGAVYVSEPCAFAKNEVIEGNLGGIKAMLCALLACINHPKIIGRRQHMPHRGLEKRLNRTFGVGKFPLHAWTEIKLEVTPTIDARRDPSIEAHYTGKRALHFCRAHLRVWNGLLIFVSAHWRGDAAIGIKRSRYKVVAGGLNASSV